MGCFGLMGSISHLPVCAGDDAFCMIGVFRVGKDIESDRYAPGHSFNPLFLPVFGKYDDYGCLEDIVKDDNTKFICDFFGEKDIEKVLEKIDDIQVGRGDSDGVYEEKINEVLSSFINRRKGILDMLKQINVDVSMIEKEDDAEHFELGYIIDHKYVYDLMSKKPSFTFAINHEKSYEITKDILSRAPKEEEGMSESDRLWWKKYELSKFFEDEFDKATKDHKRCEENNYESYLFLYPDRDLNFINSYFSRSGEYCYREIYLKPYHESSILFEDAFKDLFIGFLNFEQYCGFTNIVIEPNVYGGQEYFSDEHIAMLEAGLKLLKERKSLYEEDE